MASDPKGTLKALWEGKDPVTGEYYFFERQGIYKKNGEIFAWDVTVAEKKLPKVKKILNEYS